MASITLQINERKNLINSKLRGPKTLYVYPTVNWPAGAGAAVPSIPLDIILECTVRYGEVSAFSSFPLPNVGYSGNFSGDEIIVNAFYSPAQGLAVPFNQYIINAGVIPGHQQGTFSQYVQKWVPQQGVQYWPAGGVGWNPVPPFSTEVRLSSNMVGQLLFREYAVLAGTQWIKRYDWQELDAWTSINPLAAEWRGIVEHSSFSMPWANERGSSVLDFR